jgi:transcriptional regulator with XRE-family HTH domain
VPTSHSVQEARQALADRLREMRLDAELTATELALRVGWHRTKVSKLEHAVTSPSAEDIRMWCHACVATDQMANLIASMRAVKSAYVEWQRMERAGLRQLQEAAFPLYERTRLFRIYEPGMVPGLLQTEEYARALMRSIIAFRSIPDDTDEAVAARIARQHVLHSGDHRFAVVLEEQVLWTRIGPAETMAGQLGHLLTMAARPQMSLGIIPRAADRASMWPVQGFWIFDSGRVHVELPSAQVKVTQPREVEVYARTFNELSAMAVYGPAARALMAAAIDALE